MRSFVLLPIIAVLALLLVTPPAPARAEVSMVVGVNFGPPPPLPVYVQPPVPGPNYIWTPGYWAWGPAGYFWVPGTWVLAPAPGLMWTPGYWAYDDDAYVWYPGYWAPNVGFYGGVPYGFGYFGVGYVGGYWDGHDFRYNRAVTNVNQVFVRNVYFDRTVIVNRSFNRICYDNGPGGLHARPTWRDDAVRFFERHDPPTAWQTRNQRFAATNRNFLASVNHGRPAFAAVERPLSRTNHPGFAAIRPRDRMAALPHHASGSTTTARVRGNTNLTARHAQGGSHQQTYRQGGSHPQGAQYRQGGTYPQAVGHSYSSKPVNNGAHQSHSGQSQSGQAPHGHGH